MLHACMACTACKPILYEGHSACSIVVLQTMYRGRQAACLSFTPPELLGVLALLACALLHTPNTCTTQ